MNNIQFGKCLNDIPLDKIYEGMRVAFRNPFSSEHFVLGKVFMIRKDKNHTISFSIDSYEPKAMDKHSAVYIMFDNDVLTYSGYGESRLRNVFYVEENK